MRPWEKEKNIRAYLTWLKATYNLSDEVLDLIYKEIKKEEIKDNNNK